MYTPEPSDVCCVVEGEKKELFSLSFVPLNSSEQVLILAKHHISYRVGRPNGEGRLLLFLNSPLTHTLSGWAKTPSRAHAEGKTRGKFDDNLTHFTRFELSLSLQCAQMRFFPFSSFRCFSRFFFKNSRVNIYSISIFIIQNNHPYPEHTIHFEFFYIELHDEHHMILLGRLYRPSTPRFTSCGTCAGFFVDD